MDLLFYTVLFLGGPHQQILTGSAETTNNSINVNDTTTVSVTPTMSTITSTDRDFLTKTSAVVNDGSWATQPGNTSGAGTSSSWATPTADTSTQQATTTSSHMSTVKPAWTTAAESPKVSVTSSGGLSTPNGEVTPTQATGNNLTMLAFGVMSFILILIIVMVILVTAVNLRGRCKNPKMEGKKSGDSIVSESNVTSNGEKESITLVSMKTIHDETDTDSPQISSTHSHTPDNEDQDLNRDLLYNKMV